MNYRNRVVVVLLFPLILAILSGLALADSEIEPNDNLATATELTRQTEMSGTINPAGDLDYFIIPGVNPTWGFIALLDTSNSTGSAGGTITALNNSGMVLQADTGSWENGSGIALQSYTDNHSTHYLLVNEDGNDEQITPYMLRYYETITSTQPEVEPNDTPATGTPSAFSHAGTIDSAADVDCYIFHGRVGDTILIALNGDPEGDGSPADPVLELLDPVGNILKAADITTLGGKEFIEYTGLSSEGVYCYRVWNQSGSAGPTATYEVGIVRNGALYFPGYTQGPTWLDKPPEGTVRVGEQFTVELSVQNTSPVTIPGNIRLSASYNSDCLQLVGTSPEATAIWSGNVSWHGQKTELAPDEAYSVTLTLKAMAPCSDKLAQHTGLDYYLTSAYGAIDFMIESGSNVSILPLLLLE